MSCRQRCRRAGSAAQALPGAAVRSNQSMMRVLSTISAAIVQHQRRAP